MYAYKVLFKSKRINLFFKEIIYLNCDTIENGLKILNDSCDNIISIKYLHEDLTRLNKKTFDKVSLGINYLDLIYDYLNGSKYIYLEEIFEKFGFRPYISYGSLFRKMGYKYDKINNVYVLKA